MERTQELELVAEASTAVAKYTLEFCRHLDANMAFGRAAQRGSGSEAARDVNWSNQDLDTAADNLDKVGRQLVALLHRETLNDPTYGDDYHFRWCSIGIVRLSTDDDEQHFYGLLRDQEHPSQWSSPDDWLKLFSELSAILGELVHQA